LQWVNSRHVLTCFSLPAPSYTPSQADVHVFKALSSAPAAATSPHAARWYSHIKSYEAEFGSLPGSSTAGETFTKAAAAAAAPAAAAEDDDDEVDLFGSDDEVDEEAERIKAERVAAYNVKKADKPKTTAKVRRRPNWLSLPLF
jgi:elongation factor 1-beta